MTAGFAHQRCDPIALVWWGRPDQLLRVGNSIAPVEQKPGAHQVRPSHIAQVAAQCALIEDVYGVRPPYGILVLAGGVQHQIRYSPELQERLLEILGEMRALLASDAAPGAVWVAPKCGACGFAQTCWH